ncbi:MAG: hypothetical protein NZM40_06025 [Sphingomonadaceae bacterium]|nr:hypothetical protein [Sphingomonadaceae bacterium]
MTVAISLKDIDEYTPISSAIVQTANVRDLFNFQSPLKEDTYFFGRARFIQDVVNAATLGQNSSIFGLRKSGKTSAAYAVARRSKAAHVNTVYIDCQNPSIHARRWHELLLFVLLKTQEALNRRRSQPPGQLEVHKVSEWFIHSMLDSVSAARRPLLIQFDEIEQISPSTTASKHWREEDDALWFWQTIRSLSQNNAGQKISICFVGTSPQLIEMPKLQGVDNPVYLFAPKLFLPRLSLSEVSDMVKKLGFLMGLDFTDEAIAEIHYRYAGHPFFSRQLCSRIHVSLGSCRPVRVLRKTVQDVDAAYQAEIDHYLEGILLNIRENYADEFDALVRFCRGDQSELDEILEKEPTLVDHLVGYGLIERQGAKVAIVFDNLPRIVDRLSPRRPTEEQAWTEIMVGRNRIERSIRLAILLELRRLTETEVEEIPTASLREENITMYRNCGMEALLDPNRSSLYLIELLRTVRHEAIFPYLGERRREILELIDTLNRLRKDAHARMLSGSELEKARGAIAVLERWFPFVGS